MFNGNGGGVPFTSYQQVCRNLVITRHFRHSLHLPHMPHSPLATMSETLENVGWLALDTYPFVLLATP